MEAENSLRENLRDCPVFICGHPKSGTTLLRAILDSHPQLLVYPDETFYFRGFLPEVKTLGSDEKISLAQRYLLHFFTPNQPAEAGPQDQDARYRLYVETCDAMREALAEHELRHDGDLLFAAIFAFGLAHHQASKLTQYWVEKTPYNEHFADTIYRWWPEARCLHVVRDARDNYATYHRKHSGLAVEEFAASWKASLRAGMRNQKRFGEQRYKIIKYEQLTQQPDQVIKEITGFLGIHDDDILMTPTTNGILWEGNSMFDDRFTAISSKPLGRWKTQLEPEEVGLIEMVCGAWMKPMGYSLQGRRTPKTFLRLMAWYLKQTARLPGELMATARRRYGVLPQ
jgi:hypothetical protein